MNRRSFVATAAATLAASRWSIGQSSSESAKLARLSLMTLPWDPFLKVPGYNQKSDHSLDIVDVPDMFADRYGIHSIELQYQHVPIADPAVMQELLLRIKKAHSRLMQINVEHSETISSPEPEKREVITKLVTEWIDRAVAFDCPRIMIYQGMDLTPEKLTWAIPTLKKLGDYARSKKIKLCMETRARSLSHRTPGPNVAYGPEVQPPPPAWVKNDNTRAAWLLAKPYVLPNYTPAPEPVVWSEPNGQDLLLLKLAKATGTYVNIDIGGMAVETDKDMEYGIRQMLPVTSGAAHVNWRGNPGWDLPTTLHTFERLKYRGQYTIEANQHQDAYAIVAGLREVVLANI